MSLEALRWEGDRLLILDQTRLPADRVYLACRDFRAVAGAIAGMRVRGVPAIGVAAAKTPEEAFPALS